MTETNRVELSVGQILEDLKNGVTRTQMIEKYGLKKADISRIFQHPSLKGRRVHTAVTKPRVPKAPRVPSFILKDESGEDVTTSLYKGKAVATETPEEVTTVDGW